MHTPAAEGSAHNRAADARRGCHRLAARIHCPWPISHSRLCRALRRAVPCADAGHFILGETNEVSKRVAQFQFTREGFMGLLGSGGASFGAVPYVPHVWYRIDLTFNWEKKDVRARACAVPAEGWGQPPRCVHGLAGLACAMRARSI